MASLIRQVISLESGQGYLPLWMAFVSGIAVFNAVQNYITTTLTKKVYSKTDQVTDLSSRTFGTWTLTSALIRLYAAANIRDANMYDLALLSYYVAGLHFGLEILVYRTARWGALSPVLVATTSIVWMTMQRSAYVVL